MLQICLVLSIGVSWLQFPPVVAAKEQAKITHENKGSVIFTLPHSLIPNNVLFKGKGSIMNWEKDTGLETRLSRHFAFH